MSRRRPRSHYDYGVDELPTIVPFDGGIPVAQVVGGRGPRVIQRSVLAPLSFMPHINDTDTHSITYPDDGSAFRMHSEPSEPYHAHPSLDSALDELEEVQWGEPYFADLRDRLRFALAEQELKSPEPPEGTEYAGPLAELAAILDGTLGAVMALLPHRPNAR